MTASIAFYLSIVILLLPSTLGATPPVFATEFSLSFVVSNKQYGFVAIGTWSVDHRDDEGALHLRERTDAGNVTMHPTTQIKDYRVHRLINEDKTLPGPTHACFSPIAANVTQPAWVVPSGSVNVAEAGAAYERWRVFHATQGVCVDFFVRPAGKVPRLPFQLIYFGNCASGTKVGPAEVEAQHVCVV